MINKGNEKQFDQYLTKTINLNNAASVIIDRIQNMGISGYSESSKALQIFFDDLYTVILIDVLEGLYDKSDEDLSGWNLVAETMLIEKVNPDTIKRFYDVIVEFTNIAEKTCREIRHCRLNQI